MASDRDAKKRQELISSYRLFGTRLHSYSSVIRSKRISHEQLNKSIFVSITIKKLFYLEIVWLDRNDRRNFYFNDENEIHLKNDPFNIQVYTSLFIDKTSDENSPKK
jgi:hypothetical protein